MTKTSLVQALESVEGLENIEVDCTKKIATFKLKEADFDYEAAINQLAESEPITEGWSLK